MSYYIINRENATGFYVIEVNNKGLISSHKEIKHAAKFKTIEAARTIIEKIKKTWYIDPSEINIKTWLGNNEMVEKIRNNIIENCKRVDKQFIIVGNDGVTEITK